MAVSAPELTERDWAQACARCGACLPVCPVYRVVGRESLAARGKLHLLGTEFAASPSIRFQDIFANCLLCGGCEAVCSRHLPLTQIISQARSRLPRLFGHHPLRKQLATGVLAHQRFLDCLTRAGLSLKRLHRLPLASGMRLRLGLLEDKMPAERSTAWVVPRRGDGEIHYFRGCLATHLQPSIAAATCRLVDAISGGQVPPALDASCCGLAAWSMGNLEQARMLARHNIRIFADSTGPILTSCSSCSSHLRRYPDLFAGDGSWQARAATFAKRVCEFNAFFLPRLRRMTLFSPTRLRLFYHDPCHLKHQHSGVHSPRQLLGLVGNTELLNQDQVALCCGQGGLFHLGYPKEASEITARAARLIPKNVDRLVTTCSGCLLQWQLWFTERPQPLTVCHLAQLLVDSLEEKEE